MTDVEPIDTELDEDLADEANAPDAPAPDAPDPVPDPDGDGLATEGGAE